MQTDKEFLRLMLREVAYCAHVRGYGKGLADREAEMRKLRRVAGDLATRAGGSETGPRE